MIPTYTPLTVTSVLQAMAVLSPYAPFARVAARTRSHPFTYMVIDTGPLPTLPDADRERLLDLGWAYMEDPIWPCLSQNRNVWVHDYWPHNGSGRDLSRAQVLAMGKALSS